MNDKGLILVVEDDLGIQKGLRIFLENAGYLVDLANDGFEGVLKAQQHQYSLILLDVLMPKMNGYEVLRLLRETSTVPIIMLTALDGEGDELKGFELLADDYISKPFSMEIVLKRIEAILRRNTIAKAVKAQTSRILTYKDMSINPDNLEVKVAGKRISLTNTEYELLELLILNQSKMFTREALLNQVWGEDFFGSEHVVSVHIGNLRKKINRDYIRTIHGKGYQIDCEDET